MSYTKSLLPRRSLMGLLVLGLAMLPSAARSQAPNQNLASADQYKTEAFKALKSGNFAQSTEYLAKAAQLSSDPKDAKMADWSQQFEKQRQVFAAERQKEYEKEVANVRLLVSKGKEPYALDIASKAYTLSDDKKNFRTQPWVDELFKACVQLAQKDEAEEQWLKALRVYSDLGALEPAKPDWKDRLKTVTRRIRLLATYAPDELKKIQESESKERDQVDAILMPTTRPHKPATKPDDENSAFKTDWRDTLRDVRMDMLQAALRDADEQYYRDVTYKQLATGGLKGLRTAATTHGLEGTFKGLADDEKRQAFLKDLDEDIHTVATAEVGEGQRVTREILDQVTKQNQETVKLPDEVVVAEFADGEFGELDPFTNVIWPSEFEEFQKTTKGEFSGVGIQIQSDEDGSLRVVSPLEDSPAQRDGIKPGDVITHIEGKPAKGIMLSQAVKQITGPPNTSVTLTIRSTDGTSKDHKLVRQTIKVASVKGWAKRAGHGWDYYIDPDQKIAYLRLTNFSANTGEELSDAIDDLNHSGVRGIILDLRYNPGGLLSAAAEVCDRFIEKGVLVSTKPDRETGNQKTRIDANPHREKVDVPLVCLVNQYSASASEIVSGALKDHHRAMLVGERTFGKGSVQMLYPIDKGPGGKPRAYLKLTTSHYYLPSGRCIHREENSTEWGVDPDITVEVTPEQMRAAIDARQDQDVLRDENAPPATAPTTTRVKKDPLSADAQLSAALLMIRLKLAGAAI